MAEKKVRLTLKKRIAIQRGILADPATSAADHKRATKELERLESLPKGRPRGRPFQRKVAPESPSTSASGELAPGPATADNSRRQREAMQAATELPVESVITDADRKAADDLRAGLGVKSPEQEAAEKEQATVKRELASWASVSSPVDENQFPHTPGFLRVLLDQRFRPADEPSPAPARPSFNPEAGFNPQRDADGMLLYPPFGGPRE